MEKAENRILKPPVLIAYLVAFYTIWTIWEFWGSPMIDHAIESQYISQLLKSGVIKNLVWTLPAVFLIRYFKDTVSVGLKEMLTQTVNLLKYLPIFLGFTVYLLIGAVLQNGKLAVSNTFSLSSLITVFFAGITEELVFRGWLLNVTVSENKKWLPVIFNALLFLLIHFPIWIYEGHFAESFQSLGFLSLLILGIIFSWTFIKSKNIWIPISLHMYWDFLVFLLY